MRKMKFKLFSSEMEFLAFLFSLFILAYGLNCTNCEKKSFVKPALYNLIAKKILINGINNKNQFRDKCVNLLINEEFKKHGTTYLFVEDGLHHKNLIHNLQQHFIHSYYTELDQLSTSNFASFQHLVIFHNKIKTENVIKKMNPIQGTKFFILVRNYEEAIEQFKKLWEYRVVDAVAIFMVNHTVSYYTYYPYDKNHCGRVGTPYLVAQCDTLQGSFFHKEKLFPKKNENLHKCSVEVTFVRNIPSSYYSDSHKLIGWEVDLLTDIIKNLNGVPKFRLLSSRKRVYENSVGYQHLVKNSDVGGGALVSLRSLLKTDFCLYGQSVCSVWVVPKRNSASQSADFIFKVFPVRVWLLLIMSFFMMAAAYRLLFKVTWANVLFKLLPYLLGTTTRTRRTSKLLGSTWLSFCVFMNAIYQSGYQSAILVPVSIPQPTTTIEILKSDLKIMGVPDIIKDILPYYKDRYNISSRRLKMIKRKMTYEDWVYRMMVKKDSAYLGFKETIQYHVERTEMANVLNIPETCNMKYLLTFVLKKNSHLTTPFVKYSNRLNENGFVVHFMRKHLSRESKYNIPHKLKILPTKTDENNMPLPIDTNKMFAVFMFHATGVVTAFLFFLLEIMSRWKWKKIKQNIIDNLKSAWDFNV